MNKYYPPDFDPRKHKNLDKYNNTHALRERAKKIDQGILVIRFEMPYDIWCEGCKIHIAMGVRYNAEKRKVGYYYSTPIYRFRMKCHLCENYFEIETDPKNVDYNIIIGAQRKNEKWDMADNEQVLTEDRQVVKKLGSDAMFKLEHEVEDKKKFQKAAPTLSEIVDIQSNWHDDYTQNSILRAKFRKEKKELKEEELKDKALLLKSSLDIELVPETEDDKKLASLLKYKTIESYDEKQQRKRSEIQSQSIFISSPSSTSTSPGEETKSTKLIKLQKRLDLAKTSPSGGFGAFDCEVRKRKASSMPGVLVKRKIGEKSAMLKKPRTSESANPKQLTTSEIKNKVSERLEFLETEFSEASSPAVLDKRSAGDFDGAESEESPSAVKRSNSESPVGGIRAEKNLSNVCSPSKSIDSSSGIPSTASSSSNDIHCAPRGEDGSLPNPTKMAESWCNHGLFSSGNSNCSEDHGCEIQDKVNLNPLYSSVTEQIKEDSGGDADGLNCSKKVAPINASLSLVGDYSNSSSDSDEQV